MAKTRGRSSAKAPSGSAPRRPGAAADARLRALYAAPPADFTAARDALARELAAEGSGDAPRVKRLRRPTLPVWLLNALARERPEELGELLAAGDQLRQAQVRALRGETADLRTANSALSDAIADLLRAAAGISVARLGRDPAASLIGEVERGLRAATTADASERTALQRGVLDHVPEPGGLELLAGLSAVAAPRDADARARTPATPPRRTAHAKPDARAAERARQAEEKLARAEAARRDRERRRAAAEVERLERAERQADARVREAERAIEDAERRLAIARNEADRARASARSARERADAAHRS